jgi:sulfate adenylyltransferase subunit 1
VNLALLTDGLRSEREQGITIDVAYRYFATPKRKFIIADTPGHVQYTRNMVTGASTANVALILIDARNGVVEQTLRHTFIASLLQIPHVFICVNKMDLVDYSQEVYDKIKSDFEKVRQNLNPQDVHFVPISALKGDNVVEKYGNMDWYQGPTLMHLLETIEIVSDRNFEDSRFPVQYVVRPQSQEYHDYRGYAGRVAGGVFKPGDEVQIMSSGLKTKIKGIDLFGEALPMAYPPQSVTLTLEDEIDISRGDMIVDANNLPNSSQEIEMMICWLSDKPMIPSGKYTLRHTTKEVRCLIKEVVYKININTLEKDYEDKNIGVNEIACVKVKTTQPLFFDSYVKNRQTGSLVLIDEATNNTVCAGMIE